ncbi:MAG: (d)CMP kinase [Actinomycetota bacterium]|nr:(d)CMP kinase [Actinomycetota bacterium]
MTGTMKVVAIDGPAGAGKSTVASGVARALGWRYLDTGALYRSVALAALGRDVDLADGAALGRLVRSLDLDLSDGRVRVDGRDVTEAIRAHEITEAVSTVAAHPEVRAALLERQRHEAESGEVVIEGRDIGSRVVPGAGVKVWLTASLEERARRRAADLDLSPEDAQRVGLEGSIRDRDEADSNREASPFRRSPDAATVDSTGRPIDEVVAEIVRLARERFHGG